ncbi:MAG: CPBP family intramembrane metalloprotease [Gemmataceae bacterium]|nr:CPBP family intramembrane metalloprotease [Gemmataceae bacterium]
MLFAIKNRLWPSLALLIVFVTGASWARNVLGLSWDLDWLPGFEFSLLLSTIALISSDGGVHGLLALALGEPYRRRYRALAEFFLPQRWPQILAGGLLAGGEELVFRGVLLEWLRSREGLSATAAVAIAAVVFGLAHTIPQRLLWPFTFWAMWEGALLGIVYVWTESLLLVMVLHVLHDVGGFSLFAMQRRLWAREGMTS